MIRKTVSEYVSAINEHNIEKIYDLMSDDHVFMDTYASEVRGRDIMKNGWTGYFDWFPDYRIEISDMFVKDNMAAIIGFASGTYRGEKTTDNEKFWRLPAAWKAAVADGKVSFWQVICDSKIPISIMDEADRKRVPDVNPKLKRNC